MWLCSGVTVVGSVCLVRPLPSSSLFKSQSTFVDTTFSVKLHSLVCRPVLFMIKEAQLTVQHSAKISPRLKFSNTPALSDEKLLHKICSCYWGGLSWAFYLVYKALLELTFPVRIFSSAASSEDFFFKPQSCRKAPP